MRSTVARRGLALIAATLLSSSLLFVTSVAVVLADSPLPGTINASVSGMTATVSGSWTWDGRKPGCDDKYAGWQVHWSDPDDPGNPLKDGTGYFVGTASDNTIRTNQECAAAGVTSPMSHTYATPGTYTVCIVMYDIHRGDLGKSGGHGSVAGGPDRNKDNSVEDGKLAFGGPGCTQLTIAAPPTPTPTPSPPPTPTPSPTPTPTPTPSPTPTATPTRSPGATATPTATPSATPSSTPLPFARLNVRKTASPATADPGDVISYSIVLDNNGTGSATAITVTDDLSQVLAHGSFQSASGGGTLSGTTLRWPAVNVAANATVTLSYSVKLDLGGWSPGTTTMRNTVVVANSDCSSGSANPNCAATVSVTPRFGLSATKGAATSQSGPFAASLTTTTGSTVWYSIRVANTGNATLTGLTVVDSMGLPSGQCAVVPASLAPGDAYSCTYFRTATQGTTVNTVTANSVQTSAVSDSASVTTAAPAAPAIRISASASATSLPVGGGSVTYSYAVTNPGNVQLSSVSVSDTACAPVTRTGGDTDGDGRLDPDETWRFSCSETVTSTTTSSATARGTSNGDTVTATDSVTVTVAVGAPAISLEVSASPTSLAAGGGRVTYTYTVRNTGNAPLSGVSVSDARCVGVGFTGGDGNGNARLDTSETWRYACATTLAASTTNAATVRATFNGITVTDSAAVAVTVASTQAGIRIVTAANPTSLPAGGGQVTYTYVVTSTGNVALTGVGVADDRCAPVGYVSGDTDGDDRLDVSETWQFRCSMRLSATTTNTATAAGTGGGTRVSDTDRATVSVTPTAAAINVTVVATPTTLPATLPAGGGNVNYSYVVTNKGNVALSNISLVDDTCAGVRATGGDTNGNARLEPSETWTFSCATRISSTTTNTALVTGFSNGSPVTDTDTALVTVGQPTARTPRISLTKTANPVSLPAGGGTVVYTFAVANKGDAPLTTVSVVDDVCAPVEYASGDDDGDRVLDTGETWMFTCSQVITQTTTNAAVARGVYQGSAVTAADDATVTVAPSTPTPSDPNAPTPTPSGGVQESPTPSDGAQPTPTDGGQPTPSDGTPSGPGTSPGGETPGTSGAPTGPGGSSLPTFGPSNPGTQGGPVPTGSVEGVVGGQDGPTPPPGEGYITTFQQQSPSGLVMILVLLIGVAASVVIMTLSKRTSDA